MLTVAVAAAAVVAPATAAAAVLAPTIDADAVPNVVAAETAMVYITTVLIQTNEFQVASGITFVS